MNKYNPRGFKPGDIVILDSGHPNWCKVRIVEFTPMEMFAKVHKVEDPPASAWETMTNRLSPNI
jgi:hypothetical protein